MRKLSMDFERLYRNAHMAGLCAGYSRESVPSIVNDGVCGFIWINIKPANCAFARWLKKTGKIDHVSNGGYNILCSEFNQSMERNEKYAHAFANVLRAHGIKACVVSRSGNSNLKMNYI